MFTFEKAREAVNSYFYCRKVRKLNRNRDFSIISSNCVGTGIYQDLGIKYNTPTIGLYFKPSCYVKFVSDLRFYLNTPLSFTRKSKYFETEQSYPIGLLNGDVEIHFLHYKTQEDARRKWEDRAKRVNYSDVYFILVESSGATIADLEQFDKLNFEHKVCFTTKEYPHLKSAICVKEFEGCDYVGDIYSSRLYRKYIDVVKWLNRD